MNKPELYAKLNYNVTMAKKQFGQYWHHIKWGEKPESIIDVGVGDGKVTKQVIIPRLPSNVKEYIGSDASQEMLNYSRGVIDYPKYQTRLMDICANKIPVEYENRFDKVFASFLLHILGERLSQGVLNLRKLLKPGGQLIYTAFESMPTDEAFENLDKTKWRKYQHSKFISAFWKKPDPTGEYRKLMGEIRFRENFISTENETIRLPDLPTAKNVWESVNMILKDVPAQEYHEYLEEYFKFIQAQQIHSLDKTTGELLFDAKLIFSISTKPEC